ncbi:transcriptional repressor of class III stress genes [Halobacteroides halobius DSM 5150]|uniref:Transcriptional repressor of class III stress genes n=1 Tax=Halobacteroides halobius (strain ATCC 35273 / DSM 5150 / MD-1) TaxID=748449 RepID=L0K6K6_HALHC|nr:CtsR family transcriptional regulator [Halobacteroides halobius]AGB40165.1 transcriptional repressor of class III stress genes [Halobacteroides halobius DSM 5150]
MASLADQIEKYLKRLLGHNNIIKLKRINLSKKFDCAPSQINYVLNTRFTRERGYLIDSQRGGAGYIMVTKIKLTSKCKILNQLFDNIKDQINQRKALNIIERLYEIKVISLAEKKLFKELIDKQTLGLESSKCDLVRARLLKSILKSLVKKEG